MPHVAIKTKKDERYWRQAKSSVKKNYPEVKVGSDRYYRIVMGIVKKRKGE